VTRQGRAHPAFRAVGSCLAATGHLAVVVEPEGLAVGELTPATVEQAHAAVAAARGDGVSLVGVSGGATLALLVAGDPVIGKWVRRVTAIAPCCDIGEALRMVTTGVYRQHAQSVPFASGDFFRLVIARSVVGWLRTGGDRARLRAHLLALEDYGPDPLAVLRTWPRDELGDDAHALLDLLANESPERFDGLLAALPEELRANVALLSPTSHAGGVTAPVEVVVPREDKYLPFADARAYADACPHARLTVLDSLEHVVPTVSPFDLRSLAQLAAVLVRLFAGARTPAYSSA
jgi:pimeloyl-ACP methyl ester carboxylesterase